MATETEIEDLQVEILDKIFSFLPSDERQLLRAVCRNWESVVNEAYGIKLVINNSNVDLLYSSQWAVEVDFDSMTKAIVGEIAFAYRVKAVTFRCMVVFYNLIPILQACSNVKTLCFREVLVDLPESSIQMPTDPITLSHVTKLVLHSWSFSDSLMAIFSLLTKVIFGQLSEIAVPSGYSPVLPITLIFFPTADASNNSDIHPLIRVVLKNIQTLQKFSFGTTNAPVKLKFYSFGLFESSQLEETEISLFHNEWTTIFQNQIHMKVLYIGNCKVDQWGELRDTITRNTATIKSIKLQGRTFGQTWDCGIFQPTQLEKLSLGIIMSPKTGLNSLPISLVFLELDGPIAISELAHILTLVNLQELYFKGMGINLINIPDLDISERIDLPLFRSFLVGLPNLNVLSFYECGSNAMEWDEICDWCSQISEKHRIQFREYFYDMHGQLFKHGLSFIFPKDIIVDRSLLLETSAPADEDEEETGSIMSSGTFNTFNLF